MALATIGSAGVGQLADDWLVCPRLKCVAPLEVPVTLEPAASLVLMLAPLESYVSLLEGCDAVGQLWP